MRRLISTISLTMVLAACATSPTGRTQILLVPPDLVINESRMAYQQTLGELASSGRMLYDPALAERVGRITGRLVAAAAQTWPHTAGWEWSVALIDDPETVNAWCMAGGRMAIYSGLLSKLNPSDDELAHVLGHEITHAVANHSAERMSLAILQGLAVTAIGIETGDRDTAEAADMLATVALSLPNSRVAEYEADQLGMELAYRAGYEPAAAVTLWNKMSAENGGAGVFQFLSTHPHPDNRAARLAIQADQLRNQPPPRPPQPRPVRIHP